MPGLQLTRLPKQETPTSPIRSLSRMQTPFWQAVKDVGLASMPKGSLQAHIALIRGPETPGSPRLDQGADRSLIERVMDGAPTPNSRLDEFKKRQPHLYRPSSREDLSSYDSNSVDSYLGDLKSTLTPRGENKVDRWTKSALEASAPPPPPPAHQKPAFINTLTTPTKQSSSESGTSSEAECKSPLSPVPAHKPVNLEANDLYEVLGTKSDISSNNMQRTVAQSTE